MYCIFKLRIVAVNLKILPCVARQKGRPMVRLGDYVGHRRWPWARPGSMFGFASLASAFPREGCSKR